ncbi:MULTISPECIES: hypothetical protein [unclassified Paraflavitalea]|uniref:hypothetical protein n=1 Tax=unclassified Paraflavitalea TaxID=2798305 RepID=UPI003D32B82C
MMRIYLSNPTKIEKEFYDYYRPEISSRIGSQIKYVSDRIKNVKQRDQFFNTKQIKKLDLSKGKRLSKLKDVYFILKGLSSEDELKRILIGAPSVLADLAKSKQYECRLVKFFLSKIFDYKSLSKKSKGYYLYKLSSDIGIKVCVYCNISFIKTVYSKEKKQVLRPIFDHFYSKSRFPLLAMSLYNLIPCCYYCNSSLKGNVEFSLENNLHPYIEGFSSDIEFGLSYESQSSVNFLDESSFSIVLNKSKSCTKDKERRGLGTAKNSKNANAKVFKTTDVYNNYKDVIGIFLFQIQSFQQDYQIAVTNITNTSRESVLKRIDRVLGIRRPPEQQIHHSFGKIKNDIGRKFLKVSYMVKLDSN